MSYRFFLALILLLCCACAANAADKKQLLLIGQKRDNHPPTTHEFMAGLRVLEKCLAPAKDVEVRTLEVAEPWPEGPDLIRAADGLVLYVSEGAKWMSADPRRKQAIEQLASRGGGLTALHWGIGCRDAEFVPAFTQLFGACHGGPDRRYQVLETRLSPVGDHPVLRGLQPITVHDEFYYKLKCPAGDSQPRALLTATIDGEEETVSVAWERPDGGRSFGFTALHFHENWTKPFYRRLVTQGVLWTLKLDIPTAGIDVEIDESVLQLK